ncbi:beta-L-arabinofuranosidase domain-containing protein [Propioniciclava coleopterorum]|uniref:glycoside hydrolase family 127 protein n=1 Tax=Propioniciclava coleopterorum TaxID=2714937 RepID=UPI00197D680D
MRPPGDRDRARRAVPAHGGAPAPRSGRPHDRPPGHRTLSPDPLRAPYFQDHLPVRESTDAVGHAVRQLYLNAGATDVALETGDPGLRAAMDAQWASVHDRKMYLTGAYGSRQAGEAFGDDHELPPDVAYAETCATIADLHWAWRMLLADGGAGAAAYAAAIERDTHNALAAAVDGTVTRFFYANPLQLRPDRLSGESTTRDRVPWFVCACCPPNIARTVAQYGAYLASTRDATLHLHQLAAAELALPAELGSGGVRVATDYPRSGRIEVEVSGAPAAGAELAVRVPDWSSAAELVAPDGRRHARGADGYARAPLTPGSYALDLDLTPRFTRAHHRVDAVRGCVAVERGPLVYCVEQVDLPADVAVDDLRVLVDRGIGVDAAGGLHVTCVVAAAEDGLYRPEGSVAGSGREVDVPLLPFAEWGRRGSPAMRVWLPTA